MWRGTRAETRRIGGRTEGYERQENLEGGKWDSQRGRHQEKLRKILQCFEIFCNKNNTKRQEQLRKWAGTRSKKAQEAGGSDPPAVMLF